MSSADINLAVLQPGQRIKPNVSAQTAEQLIQQEFGLKISRIKELNSYDDNNYYVEAVDSTGEPRGKYVFKILNSMDSRKTGHIEAENDCMLFLSKKGISCPVPQMSRNGKTFSIVTASQPTSVDGDNNVTTEDVHAVRLLSFVEGSILADAPFTTQLLFDAGSYLAKMENLLKDFSHPAIESHSSIWQLEQTPTLRQFLYITEKDPAHYNLVDDILKEFVKTVVPQYPNLEKGVLHGDFNEQNVLVRSDEDSPENAGHYVYGVIDFGDMHVSYYVFELAILMCYMMLECVKVDGLDTFEGAGHALAGYMKHRKVSALEFRLLRTCICARLCQSVVLGAYTHSLDVGNSYLLTTQQRGWVLLEKLWTQTTNQQLQNIWKNVIEKY